MTYATVAATIRVLVADDEPFMRAALADILSDESSLDLVAVAAEPGSAVELAAQIRPDVAVVDVRMPDGGGAQAARGIREVSPATAVLALSASDDRESVFGMLQAGAVGYLVKGTATSEVVEAIHRATQHQPTLSSAATAHVVKRLSTDLHQEQEREQHRRTQEAQIRRFIAGDGIRTVFQPIVDLGQPETVGYEALARFSAPSPHRPDECFAAAEAVGLRTELELTAVQTALAQLPRIPSNAYLSVNASPHTITSPAFRRLLATGDQTRVVVEVTEHTAIADYSEFLRHVRLLRAAGVRLAVDDAGAGFSCLQHVLQLAPELIKLDRTITQQVDCERRHAALAAALVAFARQTDAQLVAEAIETEAQLSALRTLGVSFGQGYLLGRPDDPPTAR